MLLDGLHIPLTTPFHPDGRLNLHKLAANVVRYSRTPAAGLIVLDPSGEPTLLSDDETREVLRTAAEAAAPEKVLIAGISRDSVHATLDLANYAAEQNYDAVLVGVPGFLAPEAGISRLDSNQWPIPLSKWWLTELRTFFQVLADQSPLPVILLNTRGRTLSITRAREVVPHPNIIGLIDTHSSEELTTAGIKTFLNQASDLRRDVTVTHNFAAVTGRMKKAAADATTSLISASSLSGASSTAVAEPPALPTLRTRTKSVGFQIIAEHARNALHALNAGAVGIAPAFAAAAPQATYEIFAAWKDQDQPLAQEKQDRIVQAAQLIERLGPGSLKFACDLNGYFGGLPRLPHIPPTGEERTALEQLMKPLRN